jgi:DNA repair exonuclease SbcCD ATPase subunit
MSNIILQSLHLVNFKGVRELEASFEPGTSLVCGENGTGKTTVFDAFTWLLFGKDSTNRSDSNFNIKTLDEQGKPILRLEHSVTAILLVDGKELKLKRMYREKWEKPSGTTTETLKNHETLFYVNDVKLPTKREYDARISGIISENVFRMITNPFYFTSLKAEDQKAMLLEMAGDVTDADVARLDPAFDDFLTALAGTDIWEKAKEVKAKKSACNEELRVIPSKIETAEKLKPEAEDWDALDAALAEKRKELADIDALMRNDKSAQNAQVYEQRNRLQAQINGKKLERSNRVSTLHLNADAVYNENVRKSENVAAQQRQEKQRAINEARQNQANREGVVRSEAGKAYTEAKARVQEIETAITGKRAAIKGLEATKSNLESDIMDAQSNVSDTESNISEKTSEIESLRAEYRSLYASQVSFDPDAFICPTCKRPLEADDVDAKRAELEANFNAQKAEKIKANTDKGKALKAKLEALQATLTRQKKTLADKDCSLIETTQAIEKAEAELKALEVELVSAKANVPSVPDYAAALAADQEYQQHTKAIEVLTKDMEAIVAEPVEKPDYAKIEMADQVVIGLTNDINELQNQLDAIQEPSQAELFNTPADYEGQKKAINDEIDALNQRIGKKAVIERAQKEIDELETQRTNLNQEVADLEQWEYQALQFQKAKDAELLKRINNLFQVVSFSFVASQLNGGEKLTCVCTVNGTPYPDVNNAGKINAGLDIINAICKAKGVNAPIFVDNAESVNDVLPTSSQKILLTVTKDPSITIKH